MSNFTCTLREDKLKPNQLRKEGFVPGVIYGKNLDASVSVQMVGKELSVFLKTATIGSQVTLKVGKESYSTMIKQVDYTPLSNKLQHIDFQVLTEGEKIKTSVSLNFINKENITEEGNVQEHLSAIDYEVLPKDIIDVLDIDLSVLTFAKDIKVEDLAIASDERYHILTNLTLTIANLVPFQEVVLESDDEEAPVVAVVGEDKE